MLTTTPGRECLLREMSDNIHVLQLLFIVEGEITGALFFLFATDLNAVLAVLSNVIQKYCKSCRYCEITFFAGCKLNKQLCSMYNKRRPYPSLSIAIAGLPADEELRLSL